MPNIVHAHAQRRNKVLLPCTLLLPPAAGVLFFIKPRNFKRLWTILDILVSLQV